MTNISQLTIGLDLGDKMSDVCVLNTERKVVRSDQLPTSRESLAALFADYPGATVVFEVGSQSRWVQQLARESGLGQVITADPRKIKLITQSRNKTDRRDAYLLARVGQGLPELLSPVEHRDEAVHADLQVLRTRELLVTQRTQLVNRVRGVLKAAGLKLPSCSATYFFRQARPHIPEYLLPACAPAFAMLEAIHAQLLGIKRLLRQMLDKYPAAKQLMTTPSVGDKTALTFVLTLEDPRRIRGTRDVAAYLGLVPRKKESGKTDPQLGITKTGDTRLRRLLVLCAHHLLSRGKDCRLKRWGLELCKRGGSNGKKRAVVAVARKLSIHMLAIWRTGETYDLLRGIPDLQESATVTATA